MNLADSACLPTHLAPKIPYTQPPVAELRHWHLRVCWGSEPVFTLVWQTLEELSQLPSLSSTYCVFPFTAVCPNLRLSAVHCV